MSKPLYKIQSEHQAIIATLEEFIADGSDFEQEDLDALNHALEINAKEFLAKAEAFAAVISSKRARSAYLESEAARLKSMAKREEEAANYLHNAISKAMQQQGMSKADLDHFKLSFRKSEAVEVSIPAEKLPAEYVRMKLVYEADKTALKDALKSGETIEGATLVTRQNLQIK